MESNHKTKCNKAKQILLSNSGLVKVLSLSSVFALSNKKWGPGGGESVVKEKGSD